MPVRDILLTITILGSLVMIVKRPWVGVLVWCWLSYMNPHRLVWDFAYGKPFAQVVAIVTLVAMVFSSERLRLPRSSILPVWLGFIAWTSVTTFFAIDRQLSLMEWELFLKIQFMTLVTLLLINTRERLNLLVWVIVASLGFFGVKGGIFTIITGGQHQVLGPNKSFIEGNNELALALIMTLPLLRYLQLNAQKTWVRWGLGLTMILFAASIAGSQSRGALVAGLAMGAALFFRSRGKLRIGIAAVLVAVAVFAMMPDAWYDRMSTIQDYQKDSSAKGRINAWWFAVNLAAERPFLGGGFNTFTPLLFRRYAPDPEDFHDSHSIYFEVIAEHGFVGLGLFLLLLGLAFKSGFRMAKLVRRNPELVWARDLVAMLQVSLVGYAIGGAFLGKAYFDLYYHLLAMIMITQELVAVELRSAQEGAVGNGRKNPVGRGLVAEKES